MLVAPAAPTFSDWEHHRNEIKAQIQNYEIGVKPAVDPSMITATFSGSGTTRTLTVIVTNVVSGTNRTLTLTSRHQSPASSGTFPAIIGMNSPNGSVNSSLLTAVAKITFSHDQVTVYGAHQARTPTTGCTLLPPFLLWMSLIRDNTVHGLGASAVSLMACIS